MGNSTPQFTSLLTLDHRNRKFPWPRVIPSACAAKFSSQGCLSVSHLFFRFPLLLETEPLPLCLPQIPHSEGMFRERYYSSPLRRERSPCILLLLERVRSRINPSPCSTFSQLAKSSDHPKREFQAICDSLPPPHRTHSVFRERGQSPLDQSNLFLTHFHSQGLPLGGGEGRRKEN